MEIDPVEIGKAVLARRGELSWSQERLAALAGSSQSTIDRIEKGEFKRLPSDLPKILAALGILITGNVISWDKSGYRLPPTFMGNNDLPVYAAAEGGQGEMVVNTDPIELVPRPWYLKNVKEGYAVLITGESMVPAFEPGDLAIINPRLPYARGKDVILVAAETGGEFRASIKRLLSWNDNHWKLRQFNPPQGQQSEFTLTRKEWPKALRVVGKYYGGG